MLYFDSCAVNLRGLNDYFNDNKKNTENILLFVPAVARLLQHYIDLKKTQILVTTAAHYIIILIIILIKTTTTMMIMIQYFILREDNKSFYKVVFK